MSKDIAKIKSNLAAIEHAYSTLLFLLPISIACGAYFMYEHMQNIKTYNGNLVNGEVINRNYIKIYGIKRPLLNINIVENNTMIKAILSMDDINDMPTRVTFYYSGDNEREVYLQEETSALYISLFFIVTPIVAFYAAKIYRKHLVGKLNA